MKLKVQLVVCADDGREEHVQQMVTFEKDCQRIEHLKKQQMQWTKRGAHLLLQTRVKVLN
jgi:hypothetical protein